MAQISIPANAFVAIPQALGQPVAQLVNLNPVQGLVAANLSPFAGVIGVIRQAIGDEKLANTTGSTAAQPPPNFRFTDATVDISGTVPGDLFKGTTPGVADQFLDLTPDNMVIIGLNANLYMQSDSGNDVLAASSGRNILVAGSGNNVEIAGSGPGVDTLISDASQANDFVSVFNLGSGDDAVITGLSTADFTFNASDVLGGLLIDANRTTPVPAGGGATLAEMFLPGFKVSDFGGKLSLGLGSTSDGTSFLFAHVT